MSNYYSIPTTNAFAALDLSDDGERILANVEVKKPDPVEVPPQPAPTFSPANNRNVGTRGGRRGEGQAGTRNGDNRPAPTAAGEPSTPAGVDTRNPRGGLRTARRGGRGDNYQARDGKRTYDRQSNTKRADEDVDAQHEAADEAAAEQIAKTDERHSDEPGSPREVAAPEEPMEKRFTVDQYFKSQRAEYVSDPGSDSAHAPIEVHNDLNREIADAGFKPLVKEIVDESRQPGASKHTKTQKQRQAVELFSAVGRVPTMPGSRRPGREGGDRDRVPRRDAPSPKAAAAAPHVADEDEYPTLA